MGLLAAIIGPIADRLHIESTSLIVTSLLATFIVLAIVGNVLHQLWFRKPHEPPVVFHWVPFIGSTVAYGIDPYKFFFQCREKVIFLMKCTSHCNPGPITDLISTSMVTSLRLSY